MRFVYENYDELFDTPESIETFKKMVLEMAVRGKLVPQDPNDEPASVLLEKIKAEKEKLMEEKKIKKEKPPPPIEEEEKPFVLPERWEWVRLGDIGDWGAGATPDRGKSEYYKDGTIPWLKTAELNDGYIDETEEHITELALKNTSVRLNKIGDVLIAMYGATIGKLGIASIELTTNQACCACNVFDGLSNKFLFYFLLYMRPFFKAQGFGGAQPNYSKNKIQITPYPLPPLNEQKRIVQKIDEIFSQLPNLEKSLNERNRYNRLLNSTSLHQLTTSENDTDLKENMELVLSNFDELYNNGENVGELRQAILSLAVKGKLVPQDPNDEPASVLLEKIKAEKEKLIEEKKIRKEKPLPPIEEEEKSFELPEGWEWVRLGDVAWINPRNYIDNEMTVSFVPMKLIDGGFMNNHSYEIKKWKDVKSGFTHFKEDDVVIAKITPCFENRKSAVMKNLKNKYGAGTTELHVVRPFGNLISPKFLLSLFKTDRFIEGGVATYTGTAGQQRVNKEYIKNFVIPLPPFKEQKLIIQKIDDLFNLLKELDYYLEKANINHNKLLDSLLYEISNNAC